MKYKIYRPDGDFATANLTVPEGYGEMYIHDNAVAQTLTNQNEWYVVTDTWISGDNSGFTADTANSRIICNAPGVYHLTCQICYNGANIDAYEFSIFINGVAKIDLDTHTDARQTSQTISSSIVGIVVLSNNDIIDLRARCTSSAGTNITVVHIDISLSKVRAF